MLVLDPIEGGWYVEETPHGNRSSNGVGASRPWSGARRAYRTRGNSFGAGLDFSMPGFPLFKGEKAPVVVGEVVEHAHFPNFLIRCRWVICKKNNFQARSSVVG